MANQFRSFEKIVRNAPKLAVNDDAPEVVTDLHPFDDRNIHPAIRKSSVKLFDDGHYSQATFEAFKFIDKQVSKVSGIRKSGFSLMMQAFNEKSPSIKLTDLSDISEEDEQKGFSFLFSGAVLAIRNPRGHEVGYRETLDQCLDHLSLASMLLRKLDARK